MDAKERLALIRARLGHTVAATYSPPVGLHCAATGAPPLPRKRAARFNEYIPKKGHAHCIRLEPEPPRTLSERLMPSQRIKVRVRECYLEEPQTRGVSPLTKIAKAWEDPETFRPIPRQI